MFPLINLHNHSTHSDGTLEPGALAREAARAGIKYFSLTDHDTVGGWAEIEPALKDAGINYCRGVELTTNFHDNLHILGYGVDILNPEFLSGMAGYRQKRLERLKKIVGLLRAQGLDVNFEELPADAGRTVGRPHIAELLKKKGIVKSRKQGFQQYIASGRPAYVPPSGPEVEDAIRAVKKAGGLAVLAHPGVVKDVLDLPRWKDAGLDGIEAFYPAHTNVFTRELVTLAARYGLLVTAGVDFHGPGTDRDKMFGFEYSEEMFKGIKKAFV
ncbi:MAG: hypothetical protein A2X34_04070 [Elusimicrobia bacterium GWC2_51_8]|nr:MAG: hypothetical protein A2X33_02080 [Elusimicrobia bacterium GWA2_51_34]OGR60501.1 MAG: hypothetical protein A2X34_04070 [Elusimicrobia bacterium GWC2_51_8]OGR85151.1 MAG: hypothetical protein A2021_09490 [Elusimicrobia bacterium GWF2_52_66]HAF94510.1 hypothetical protein [Elusimicrobiota bacterium]HCE97924.1 hypothetical protein [Elusimicrobiota bacterium]